MRRKKVETKIPIRKWNYCSRLYSSDNYGSHSQAVEIGNLTLYFSYDTVVAFNFKGQQYISENLWTRTTEKHLSRINSDKSRRIKRDIFEKLLGEAINESQSYKT